MSDDRLVEIENYREVRRALRKADDETRRAVKEVDLDLSDEVAKASERYVPVLTGRLKRSLRGRQTASQGAVVSAGTGKRTLHAEPIHWGWPRRNIPRSGFLLRGLAAVGRKYDGDLAEAYRQRIEEYVMKALKEM